MQSVFFANALSISKCEPFFYFMGVTNSVWPNDAIFLFINYLVLYEIYHFQVGV